MNYGALLHLSMSTMDNIRQYHGGLQTKKLGQKTKSSLLSKATFTVSQFLDTQRCHPDLYAVASHLEVTKTN